MKKTFLTLAIIAIVQFSYAQFNTNSGNTTTSDNVGVGTNSPQSKLEVMGSGYAATKLITLSENEPARYNANIGITVGGGTQLNFGTRNDNVNFDNTLNLFNGNVGIGTASPFAKLDVKANTNARVFVTSTATDHPVITFADIDNNPQYGTIKTYDLLVTNGITNFMKINSNGNVGIGTTTAPFPLTVKGTTGQGILYNDGSIDNIMGTYSGAGFIGTTTNHPFVLWSNNTERMRINAAGYVGMGTSNPVTKLQIVGSGNPSNTEWLTLIDPQGNNGTSSSILLGQSSGVSAIQVGANNNLAIQPTGGNLLIGKTSQTNSAYKLDINGSARANEVVVNTTGADFVFEPDYKLPKLSEVKTYIDQNHHLPEIPSAAEMQKNGMSLGELNTKLLQKVEELTLYLIEKDIRDKEKDVKLQSLQLQIDQLKKN